MATDLLMWIGVVLLGLVVGSFLNVVIHRLPRMLEAQWAAAESGTDLPPSKPYNIAVPGSHCPHCSNHVCLPQLSVQSMLGFTPPRCSHWPSVCSRSFNEH